MIRVRGSEAIQPGHEGLEGRLTPIKMTWRAEGEAVMAKLSSRIPSQEPKLLQRRTPDWSDSDGTEIVSLRAEGLPRVCVAWPAGLPTSSVRCGMADEQQDLHTATAAV